MNHSSSAASPDAELETLHERVNAMLDIPVPKEGDAFPLPLEAAVGAPPSGHERDSKV
ncbi:MAG: hypothetical protein JWP47_282 [Polaromonas sp.]|jgi:hypothetical protein|nr:hypothetical protein [Polaromonas sp.]